ncbi:MAG: hypothetical protein LUC16_03085 [Coprobacillus sp.]|nr:hypothetical protein [Coprobacillus sp.]
MDPLAVVEMTSKYLKVLVGYDSGDDVCVIYSNSFPLNHYIENGHIVNKEALKDTIKSISSFYDTSMKTSFNIDEAILAIPPYGLKVYTDSPVTPVISPDGKVHTREIQTLYTMIKKGGAVPKSSGNEIVDIVPERYLLDNDKAYQSMPIGIISSSIAMDALILTLPRDLIRDFSGVFEGSGIRLRRIVTAPFAATEYIARDISTPLDYYLVDIGAEITTVSIVSTRKLYNSYHFAWGSDDITRHISESFHISFEEAESLKKEYGLDETSFSFSVPVSHNEDDGDHFLTELRDIIKEELDKFSEYLNTAIDTLMNPYDDSYRSLPMLLIGGGSLLNGLKEYLTGKVPAQSVKVFTPSSLGARSPAYTNLLGTIVVQNKYRDVLEDRKASREQANKNTKRGGK